MFGFAPYWTPAHDGINLGDLTTIAYFSVDVNGDGPSSRAGRVGSGYQSQALATSSPAPTRRETEWC